MPSVISIHSFRGGTGKSGLTANLVAALASMGETGARVGVIDTDIQSPGVHVLFGWDDRQQKYSLNDYLWGRCTIEEAAYDVSHRLQGIAKQNSQIYLIPSSIATQDIAKILREGFDFILLHEGFQRLIEVLQLDYLLIDTHPGVNEETLFSLTLSDVLIVLSRPDSQDFQGTAITLEVARQLEVPQMYLVFNQVLPSVDTQLLQQDAAAAYGVPVMKVLPYMQEMAALASSNLFFVQYPDHAYSRAIAEIAAQLMS